MTNALWHRGPDDEGIFLSAGIGLGMRRLSIVDLESGKQPIFNESGDIVIVFNGEIYNYEELRQQLLSRGHVLKTRTDTEVIVHLYEDFGVDCLERLDGMFAFALWDMRTRQLFLARDRLGEKPLYYSVWPNGLAFGSEMKAVLASRSPLSTGVNFAALSLYFTFMTVPPPRTILNSVQKLPPAHYMVCDALGHRTVKKYWDLSDWESDKMRSEDSYLEEFDARFSQAVRERLIGDVPIGAFLSGGLDSSLVVAHLARILGYQIKTFNVRFEGPSYYDESPYARAVAKHCSTEHTELTINPDILADLPKLVWHWDEPFAVSSAVPLYYMAKAAREHVKVVLTGDGGDEAFAGYSRYRWDRLMCWASGLPIPWSLLTPTTIRVRNSSAKCRLVAKFLTAAALGADAGYCFRLALFSEQEKRFLLSKDVLAEIERSRVQPTETIEQHYRNFRGTDPLARRLYGDLQVSLPDEMLTKVDRMTMAVGLEARPPFLDYQLLEFAANVPSELKVQARTGKYLLKKHAAKLLPPELVYRRKHGFEVPVNEWLRGPLRDFACDVLTGRESFTRSFFNTKAVKQILTWHIERKKSWGAHIWAMLMFEIWGRMTEALAKEAREVETSTHRTDLRLAESSPLASYRLSK